MAASLPLTVGAFARGVARSKKCGVDWDTHGEHAEHEPITGSGDGAPSGSRDRPLVKWSAGDKAP